MRLCKLTILFFISFFICLKTYTMFGMFGKTRNKNFEIIEQFDIRKKLPSIPKPNSSPNNSGDYCFIRFLRWRISPCGRYLASSGKCWGIGEPNGYLGDYYHYGCYEQNFDSDDIITQDPNILEIYDLQAKKKIFSYDNNSEICSLDISNNGKYVSIGTTDGRIKLFNLKSKNKKLFFECEFYRVRIVYITPDGKYLVAVADRVVRVYDLEIKSKIFETKLESAPYDIFLTDNGKYVAAIYRCLIEQEYRDGLVIYDVFSEKILDKKTISGDDKFSDFGLTEDGRFLAYTCRKWLWFCDYIEKDGSLLKGISLNNSSQEHGLCFSKCGNYVILLNSYNLNVYDINNIKFEFNCYVKYPNNISQIVVNKSGDRLFVTDDETWMASIKTSDDFYYSHNRSGVRNINHKNKIIKNLKKFREKKTLIDLVIK